MPLKNMDERFAISSHDRINQASEGRDRKMPAEEFRHWMLKGGNWPEAPPDRTMEPSGFRDASVTSKVALPTTSLVNSIPSPSVSYLAFAVILTPSPQRNISPLPATGVSIPPTSGSSIRPVSAKLRGQFSRD